jgi:type IV pilus assembly protein PilC
MPKFRFVAMDSKGVETEGVLDADNQSQALAVIRSKGFFPTRVVAVAGGGPTVTAKVTAKEKGLGRQIRLPRFLRARVKAKQLMVFTRQLATLVDAGVPLLRGLRILLKQEKNLALREALTGMGDAVESGSTFSDALSQHPHIFDSLFVSMVKAGEAGGVLEVVLNRLAEFMEKAERIKNKIRSAMIYPIVVMLAAVAILAFLLTNVIPKFEDIFRDLLEGKPLPMVTQFVIGVSHFVATQGLWILAGIVVAVVAIRVWKRTSSGDHAIDRMKLKLPVLGPLFGKTAIARLTRTLGTLMTSGVSVLQALNIVRDTAGNVVIADGIQKVHDAVKEGEDMSTPMEMSGVFPTMVVSMVDVGEETGALPEMLLKIADNYDDEVDTAVEGLTSIIEPILIIFLAVIIGTIVIAMFVPLITIIGQMSQ